MRADLNAVARELSHILLYFYFMHYDCEVAKLVSIVWSLRSRHPGKKRFVATN